MVRLTLRREVQRGFDEVSRVILSTCFTLGRLILFSIRIPKQRVNTRILWFTLMGHPQGRLPQAPLNHNAIKSRTNIR